MNDARAIGIDPACLPIIRNTYTAINNVDPALREAARGMGMTALQRLRKGDTA